MRTRHGVRLIAALLLTGCVALPSPEQRGSLRIEGAAEPSAERQAALRAYQEVRSARFRGWLNGSALVATRFGEITQLHRVARPLGMREQLTFGPQPVSVAWPPPVADAQGFLFASDVGGSENYQLFWFDLSTGAKTLLTDGRSRYTGVRWSRSGALYAYSTTERNGRSWDIHVRAPGGTARIALETDDIGWYVQDIAPDDERLLLRRYVSVGESYLYELSLTGGGLRPLLETGSPIGIGAARYAGDGAAVYFSSDLGGEFRRLQRIDLGTGHIEALTDAIPWDVETFAIAPDGGSLALAVNERGLSRLALLTLPERRLLALPELPDGVISGLAFSSDGEQLGFTLSGPQTPSDTFSVDLSTRKLRRWTRSEMGGLEADNLVVPEPFEFESFDRGSDGTARRIPAFAYRAAGPGPHPVLIDIHGGPASQHRPTFRHFTQYLVAELGITVIAPNVRGSFGYGKSYVGLDNGFAREDSVRDIGALLDWIAVQEDLDAQRVAVSGGSYGGYMSLASMVHYPERLRAGVDLFGISNFVTFLEGTQAYRRDLRRREYGDERDPGMRSFQERIAPLNQVDRITGPLLIYQGVNDPRVPAGESEQMVAALRARGVPVWYLVAADEGHGMRRRSTRDYVYSATAEFLARYLLDDAE
jgi:dipeptidyl aminopeptidase/acylaminoacyl peptidase